MFEPNPDLTFFDDKDLLNALANEDQIFAGIPKVSWTAKENKRNDYFSKKIKSLWLIALIDEMAKTEYPYNATVQREAEKRLGLERQNDNNSFLSYLVYYAQSYRRSDNLLAAGFVPLTQAMIAQAFERKAKIETYSEAIFEFVVNGQKLPNKNKLYVPREKNGKVYAFVPRCKNRVLSAQGQPAKIV